MLSDDMEIGKYNSMNAIRIREVRKIRMPHLALGILLLAMVVTGFALAGFNFVKNADKSIQYYYNLSNNNTHIANLALNSTKLAQETTLNTTMIYICITLFLTAFLVALCYSLLISLGKLWLPMSNKNRQKLNLKTLYQLRKEGYTDKEIEEFCLELMNHRHQLEILGMLELEKMRKAKR